MSELIFGRVAGTSGTETPVSVTTEGYVITSGSGGSVVASDGVVLPLSSLASTITYNADNTINYVQVTYNTSNYRQTYGYTSGLITSISAWVKQ